MATIPPPLSINDTEVLAPHEKIKGLDWKEIKSVRVKTMLMLIAENTQVTKILAGDFSNKKARGVPVGTIRIRRPMPYGLEIAAFDVDRLLTFFVYSKEPEEVAYFITDLKNYIQKHASRLADINL